MVAGKQLGTRPETHLHRLASRVFFEHGRALSRSDLKALDSSLTCVDLTALVLFSFLGFHPLIEVAICRAPLRLGKRLHRVVALSAHGESSDLLTEYETGLQQTMESSSTEALPHLLFRDQPFKNQLAISPRPFGIRDRPAQECA